MRQEMTFCAYKGLINFRHVPIYAQRLLQPQSPPIRPYKCKEFQNRGRSCMTVIMGNTQLYIYEELSDFFLFSFIFLSSFF
jgi:hypothetical protein